jgi:hypothetical protein
MNHNEARLNALPPLATADQLIELARKFQIRRIHEATGRCLSISLEFALAARARLGAEVMLVKWNVRDDPFYIDHWAVQLDEQNVLDLSRVQVDGSSALVCPVDGYPHNYQRRRTYPAALLLDEYVSTGASGRPRLSTRFMWICGTRLWRFDMAQAWRNASVRKAGTALTEFATFLSCFTLDASTRALEGRARRLLGRLYSLPTLSERTTVTDPVLFVERRGPGNQQSIIDMRPYQDARRAQREAIRKGLKATRR